MGKVPSFLPFGFLQVSGSDLPAKNLLIGGFLRCNCGFQTFSLRFIIPSAVFTVNFSSDAAHFLRKTD